MNKKNIEKVVILKCNSYEQSEIDKAIKRSLELLNFDKNKYKKVFIKPNVVGSFKENQEAIITNISLVKSLLKQFKKAVVGESSFSDTEMHLKNTGYWKLKPLVLEKNQTTIIHDENAKILKNFYISKHVKDSDLIINVSKLKTHVSTKMTGAIKNLYGCIPGHFKQMYHREGVGEKNFCSLLVDVYQNIKPGLNIIDAVVAMEGEGPTAGKPKRVNLILASRNAIALDIVASKLMGYNPKQVLTIREGVKRKLASYDVKIIGDFNYVPNLRFEKTSDLKRAIVKLLSIGKTKEKIIVDKDKCVKCGICAKHCPKQAITLSPYPVIDEKKCIRCFCCIEVCPHHALHLEDNLITKFINFLKKMRKYIRI